MTADGDSRSRTRGRAAIVDRARASAIKTVDGSSVGAVDSSVDAPGPGGSRSKTDHAYSFVRSEILEGRYPPGSRLVIERIAREIEVSVVPVREAIRRLEAEGYVAYTRNVGATVATIDLARYPDTAETLAILEGAATAMAVPHIRPADVAKARKLNEAMRRSVEALDPVDFTTRNHRFHRILFDRCPNTHLTKLVEREWSLLATTRRSAFTFVPDRALGSVGEHEKLLQLIEADAKVGDVERYARDHRLRTVRFLQKRIAGRAPDETLPGLLD
jgi:DNA-binding GntR family transcriptional regulator